MSLLREIKGFPKCGTSFVCGDRLSIADAWKALIGFQFVESKGMSMVPGIGIANKAISFGVSDFMDLPLCGHQGDGIFFPNSTFFDVPFEILPDASGFCLQFAIRLYDADSFSTIPFPFGTGSGAGARSANILFQLLNIDAQETQEVVHFFNDLGAFQIFVGPLPFPSVSQDIDTLLPTDSPIKIVNIVGTLNANMVLPGQRSKGLLRVKLSYPEEHGGGPWGAPAFNNGYFLLLRQPATNPETGQTTIVDGLHELAFSMFNPDPLLADLADISQNQAPIGSDLTPAIVDSLRESATRALRAGFTGAAGAGFGLGGQIRPLVGHFPFSGGPYSEAAGQQFTILCQIPPGATRVILMIQYRLDGNQAINRNQTLLITLLKNGIGGGSVFQTLFNESYNSLGQNNSIMREHIDLPLNAVMVPLTDVELGTMRVNFIVANPQTFGNRDSNWWDGLFSFLLRFV